jgi:hypothetical protein
MVPLGGAIRQVVDELPVVALAIAEIDPYAMGMRIRYGRLPIPPRKEPPAKRLGVVHLDP